MVLKWVLYIIGATLATYSVVGGITLRFQPIYLVMNMPNECTKGSAMSYGPPEQEMVVTPPWEIFNE
jgi:hypothetical protein